MRRLLETIAYIGAGLGIAAGRIAVRLLPRSLLLALFREMADLGFHFFHSYRENTLKITQWVERTVRSYPDQWNWMTVHWQQVDPEALIGKEDQYKGDEPISAAREETK